MKIDDQSFAWAAHPHEWMLVAEDLHNQLREIRLRSGESYLYFRDETGKSFRWDVTERLSFLLMALALENAIKSFLVYENPNWASNGRLGKPMRSHDLVALAQQSLRLPYKGKHISLLRLLSEGFDTWARYPCDLQSDRMGPRRSLRDAHWHQYLRLIQSYGRRMKALLSRNWQGAHNIRGNFEIGSDFFVFSDTR